MMKKPSFKQPNTVIRILILVLFLPMSHTIGFAQDSWSGVISHGDDPPQIKDINERLNWGDTTFEGRISPAPGPLTMLIDVPRVIRMLRPSVAPVPSGQAFPSSWNQGSDGSYSSTDIQAMVAQKVLSSYGSITMYMKYDSGNPNDINKPFTISGITFNGQAIDSRVYNLRIGIWKKIVLKNKVPMNLIKFGTWQGDGGLSPIPGNNSLIINSNLQSVITADKNGNLTSEVTPVVLLDFGAVAPIIFVHGFRGDSAAWMKPSTYAVNCNTPTNYYPWSSYGFRCIIDEFTGKSTATANQSTCVAGVPSNPIDVAKYLGPWSNQISLGKAGLGVSGIKYDSDQLTTKVPDILRTLGAKRCHIIAHSKGGADVRYFLNNPYQQYLENSGLEVLSLYTLSTPHRGTLAASLISQVAPLGGIYTTSSDPKILSALGQSGLFVKALYGQVGYATGSWFSGANDLIPSNTLAILPDQVPSVNKFYNLAGDGDVNGDGKIINAEAYGQIDNCPGTSTDPNQDGQTMYDILKSYSTINATFTYSPWTGKTITITPVLGSPQPNDMLIPANSALLSTNPSNLLPGMEVIKGNHGTVKSEAVGQEIISQILLDYPVEQYLSAPARYK